MEMTCPRCEGARCEACKRQGKVKEQLCPQRAASEVGLFLRGWKLLRTHGLLPVSGGWLDQTQQFLDAVAVIDLEIASAGK